VDNSLRLAGRLVEPVDVHAAPDAGTSWQRFVKQLEELLSADVNGEARAGEVGVWLITADVAGGLQVAAASTERTAELAQFEIRHGGGPGTECYRTGHSALNESLADERSPWPLFAAAARDGGFSLVSSLLVQRDEEILGVLGVLCTAERRLTLAATRVAQVLAEAAANGILQERALLHTVRRAAQLQQALDSRVLIEQAKGATAARLGITPEAAFELLRSYARSNNLVLADIARATVEGNLTVQDLTAAQGRERRRAPRRSRSPQR
jgi:ANTAR domain-containing protein/GAF domain-containing protein